MHAIAIEGTFDDCQDLVKAMFADARFRAELSLSAVNSINWARIMAQIVYYFAAAVALGAPDRAARLRRADRQFRQCLRRPCGAAHGLADRPARHRHQPQRHFGALLRDGEMRVGAVEPSLSPSMDIQVSSNFERFLFELKDGDGAAVASAMRVFRTSGTLPTSEAEWRRAEGLLSAHRVDDAGTQAEMARIYRASGELLDPHTAIAVATARAVRRDASVPMVALATAHPANFPDAVQSRDRHPAELPPALPTS